MRWLAILLVLAGCGRSPADQAYDRLVPPIVVMTRSYPLFGGPVMGVIDSRGTLWVGRSNSMNGVCETAYDLWQCGYEPGDTVGKLNRRARSATE
jgi:hypothetical protein